LAEFRDTVHTFAQDSKAHYEPLGYVVKMIPYPLNPQGQHLTFEIFEKRANILTDPATNVPNIVDPRGPKRSEPTAGDGRFTS